MLLKLDESLARGYHSNSQRIRVMSEYWIGHNAYCVVCGSVINQYANNNPASDFYCPKCKENYELKSKKGRSLLISDGAYQPMIDKVRNNETPSFFLLNYTESLDISDVVMVARYFFTESIIIPRKPLSPTARRAGWVGCNIDLKQIPEDGKIFLVKNFIVMPKNEVIEKCQKTIFLKGFSDIKSKGWTLDVMKCLDDLKKQEFTLEDLYAFETILQMKYPENHHIRPKIRQQLQILRDNGYIEFL